jgi:hypothetical protein
VLWYERNVSNQRFDCRTSNPPFAWLQYSISGYILLWYYWDFLQVMRTFVKFKNITTCFFIVKHHLSVANMLLVQWKRTQFTSVCITRFLDRNAHSKILENNLNVFGSKKTKGSRQDSQNRLYLDMHQLFWYACRSIL